MYGVYLGKMGEYVVRAYGEDVWNKARADAGIAYKVYLPSEVYPDDEVDDLISAIRKETGISTAELWEQVGISAGSSMIAAYKSLINPEWKTLEILEFLQPVIDMIRNAKGDFPHPRFDTSRISENEVLMTYESPRKLCSLAKGMAIGIGQSYGETISISESSCMCNGDSECRMVVSRKPSETSKSQISDRGIRAGTS